MPAPRADRRPRSSSSSAMLTVSPTRSSANISSPSFSDSRSPPSPPVSFPYMSMCSRGDTVVRLGGTPQGLVRNASGLRQHGAVAGLVHDGLIRDGQGLRRVGEH